MFGEVWYNPEAIMNIFSLAKMIKQHKVTFDSSKEDAFIVHMGAQEIKFKRTSNNLYTFTPTIFRDGATTMAKNQKFPTNNIFPPSKRI